MGEEREAPRADMCVGFGWRNRTGAHNRGDGELEAEKETGLITVMRSILVRGTHNRSCGGLCYGEGRRTLVKLT